MLPGPAGYTDKTTGAIFIVGNGFEDTFNEDGSIKTENRSNAFVSWNDGRATIGKAPVDAMDIANKQYVDEAVANIDIPENTSNVEWDYIIDKAEDFNSISLAALEGKNLRLLVKDVNINLFNEDTFEVITVLIPSKVDTIKFINSSTYSGNIIAQNQSTKIIGFKGTSMSFLDWTAPILDGFGGVEFCDGDICLNNCQNVIHSRIYKANNCTNMSDIRIVHNKSIDIWGENLIVGCRLIDTVTFDINAYPDDEFQPISIEFVDCSYISNVINKFEYVKIDYINCTYVDGDTCDDYYAAEDIGKVRIITADGSLQTAELSSGNNSSGISEWDYVIDKLEDFTTEKLATMSGKVLVEGISNDDILEDVEVPSAIELLEFSNSSLVVSLRGSKSTKVKGFYGSSLFDTVYPLLTGFGAVEDCHGPLMLYNCANVRRCGIRSAELCENLNDIVTVTAYEDGSYVQFKECMIIDNVRIASDDTWWGWNEIEFYQCKHVSNVHNITPSIATIDYVDCTFVDGDTCDGYYTEEDKGKVQVVNTSGEKSLISVYSQEDIDEKLGDIASILEALHSGGIE